ncbi:AzlD domain-containing protein [Bartonella sp. LJL80]
MIDTVGWGIVVAAIVTAFIRIVPILFLAHRPFPKLLKHWLHFVPAAVLSAIIAAEILAKPQTTSFGLSVALCAAFISFFAGMLTRSLFVSVIASILAYLVFQNI